jgi:hypothetical protein
VTGSETSDVSEADEPRPSNLHEFRAEMATIRKLPALVHKQFEAAQASGDLTFFETRVSVLHCEGLPECTRSSNRGISC